MFQPEFIMKVKPLTSLLALSLAAGIITPFALANSGSEPDQLMTQPRAQRMARGGRGGKFGAQRIEKLKTELNLTDEQVTQIQAIHEAARAEGEGAREQMKAEREQMKSLIGSNASRAELERQHQTLQDLRNEFGDRRFAAMLDTLEVLTPEQRSQFAELMDKHHSGPRRGRGPAGGPQGEGPDAFDS